MQVMTQMTVYAMRVMKKALERVGNDCQVLTNQVLAMFCVTIVLLEPTVIT